MNAHPTRTLFLVSVAALFLELMLIRWIGTEIRIFAYLQNAVLVVCILGLGVGCFSARRPFALRGTLLALLALVALLVAPPSRALLAQISARLAVMEDFLIWYHVLAADFWQGARSVAIGLGLTFIVMLLLWDVFVPLGRLLGRLLDEHPRTLWAYSVNVAGSLVGIWLFVACGALQLAPPVWIGLSAALLVPLVSAERRARRLELVLLAAIVGLGLFAARPAPDAVELVWSPYQKLQLRNWPDPARGRYVIDVNNVGYQWLLDASRLREPVQYELPWRLHPAPRRGLIVGAGSGNDAAGALRGGVGRLTAVDIDPAILSFGRRFHPERPYDNPQVELVNDDARAYFARSTERFDVISFGFLDSHTTAGMTNTRLDHFVYTRESLARAKELLAPGGLVVLQFLVQRPFVAARLQRTLREVFGREPLAFKDPSYPPDWGSVMLIAGDTAAVGRRLAADPALSARLERWRAAWRAAPLPAAVRPATDDWPYLYLPRPTVPLLFFLLGGLLLLLALRARWQLGLPGLLGGWRTREWHFFLLGAAFLLLETTGITRAAVALGSTWWVNAVVISGVLAMVLCANGLVALFPRLSRGAVGAALVATCIGLYFLDLAALAALPLAPRAVLVGVVVCLPMAASGVLFARSFAAAPRRDAAMGANLVGALAGGCLQALSFAVGLSAMLLLVALLYLLALASAPRD